MASIALKRGDPQSEKIKYIKNTFFVIRPNETSQDLFWIAYALEDVPAKNKEVYVRWLTVSEDETEYKISPESTSSKIPIESIIITTTLKNNTKTPNIYKISKTELKRVKNVVEEENESSSEEDEEDEEDGEEEEESDKEETTSKNKKVTSKEEKDSDSETEKKPTAAEKKKAEAALKKQKEKEAKEKQKEKEKAKKLKEKEKEKAKKLKEKEKEKEKKKKEKEEKKKKVEPKKSSSSKKSSSENQESSESSSESESESSSESESESEKESSTKKKSSKKPGKKDKKKESSLKKTKKSKKSEKEESESESESESSSSSSESSSDKESSTKKKSSTKKSTKKSSTKKKSSKKAEKESSSESESTSSSSNESESESSSSSESESNKKKSKKSKASTEKQTIKPLVEKKKTSGKRKKDEEDEEDESGNEEKETTKKSKTKSGEAKNVKKEKPPKVPKPTKASIRAQTKKGNPNPNIPELENDPELEACKTKTQPSEFCCAICTTREASRAVQVNNMELLKVIIKEGRYHSLLCPWSTSVEYSPFHYAILNNNIEAMKLIYDDLKDNERQRPSVSSFHKASTGSYSRYTYGHNVRQLTQSRGGREGDEAFIHDSSSYDTYELSWSSCSESILDCALNNNGVKLSTIEELERLDSNLFNYSELNATFIAARSGNLEVTNYLVNKYFKRGGFGFGDLHVKVLDSEGGDLPQFRPVSATKKTNQGSVTPVHFAAINPKGKYLKELVDISQDFNKPDGNIYKPIHYAAACTTPVNIQFLVSKGVEINDLNNKGYTPLMIAAKLGRVQNVKTLLKAGKDRAIKDYVKTKNKKGQDALHLAAEEGQCGSIRALIESGADVDVFEKGTRYTALMKAALNGRYDAVKVLVEEGKCDIEKKDKFKRTALVLAASNGHTKIVSYLLHFNAQPKIVDSSKNSILHFTSAYGWDSITKYLVDQFKLPINEFNDWKSTPLSISIKKGHFQTTKYLLDQNADANTCDENGTSILLQSLSSSIGSAFINNLTYLVNQGKADIQHHDKDQNGALHILCFSEVECSIKKGNETEEVYQKAVLNEKLKVFSEVANFLLEKGINIDAKNKDGYTPLMLAFEHRNVPAIIFLLEKGASLIGTYRSTGSNILHNIINFQNIHHFVRITELILKSKDLGQLVNQFNKQFVTPIMSFIRNLKSTPRAINSGTPLIFFLRELILKSKADLTLAESQPPVEEHHQNGTSSTTDAEGDEEMDESMDNSSMDEDTDDDNDEDDNDEDDDDDDDENSNDEDDHYHKSDKETNKPHILKRTALHFAVLEGSLEVVSVLFEFNIKDIDPVTVNQETPLHMAIDNNHFNIATFLVHKGCNLKLANLFDRTPLHLACAKMNFPLIKQLTIKNSPVNKQDYKGLTPLMIACKNKHNISDDALEGEDNPISILLANGADPKIVDHKKRNALHYSINASSSDTNSSFEIEDLLIKHGAPLNDQDYLGRAPLHYAFVKIGANGIDSGTSYDPVQVVSSLSSFDSIKIDLVDSFGRTPLFYACQHGATVSSLLLIQRKADINKVDEDGNSPLAFSLFFKHPDCAISLIQKGADVKANLHKYTVRVEKKEIPIDLSSKPDATIKPTKVEYKIEKQNKQTVGLFYHVISNNWQGVAYIMLDNGLDLFSSLRDAFKANKYQLALTLLSKCRNPAELKVTNAEKQNLFHFIGMYPSSVSNWASRIQAKLLSNGVSPNTQDSLGRTPLHYAAISKNEPFILFLLEQKLNINQRDKDGHTALSLSLLDIKEPRENQDFIHYTLPKEFSTLLLNKPDLNLKFKYEENMITPLIYSVIINHSYLVQKLLENKADVNHADGLGQPPIFYAIKSNNMKIVEILLAKKPNLNIKDGDKKSVIHCVVSPTEYGSFENVKLLNLLHSRGAEIDTPDIAGKTPNFYASLQESGKMREALEKLGAKKIPANTLPTREISTIFDWNQQTVNYEEDYNKYIESKKELMESSKKTLKPVVDPSSQMASNSEVYVDKESGLIYDILMTKVDAGWGSYGENSFYKMQIIYNPSLDRYFLFNRWGRIGDNGQYQKTPFNKEEAIAEFSKIFKSKSGNVFSQATVTNFVKMEGKYHLLSIDRTDRSKKELLHPFDLSKYPESKLPKEIYDAMAQFCNVEAISNQLKSLRVDTDIMPLGYLSKDVIHKAIAVLGKLNESIELVKTINAKKREEENKHSNDDGEHDDDDHKESEKLPSLNEVLESQFTLSNEFFELIPHSDFRTEKMTVLKNEKEIASKLKLLNSLDEMETVSKILIAAHQNKTMHPYDYCFKAMNLCMEKLNEGTPEFEILKKYSINTGCHQKIHNIYKIQRKGEAEKFQQHKALKNHYLLWHGSLTTNYLSILSQGLKIAPPEAPVSGYMFGKGVYFADMFSKSINYCNCWGMSGSSVSSHNFLLLSEVALGTMAEYKEAHYMESPATGTNSTKGCGRRGPNFDNSIILNNGVVIPLSKPEQVNDTNGYHLEMNEYIVYNPTQIRMRYLIEVSK